MNTGTVNDAGGIGNGGGSGVGTITNQAGAIFATSEPAGTLGIGDLFNNSGTFRVGAGTVDLIDGGVLNGSLTGAGNLDLIGSGTTYVLGASFLNGSGFTGTLEGSSYGTVSLSSSVTSNVATAISLSFSGDNMLDLAAGQTLTSSNNLSFDSLNGTFNSFDVVNGPGTLATTGTTTILGNGAASAVGLLLQAGVSWLNSGTVNDAGGIGNGGGSGVGTITNQAGGLFATMEPAGTLAVGDQFNNSGTLKIGGGTVQFGGGGTLGGSLTGTGNLDLVTSGADYILSSSFIASTGFSGHIVADNYGTLVVSTSATAHTSFSITNGSQLDVGSGVALTLPGATFSGGAELLGSGAVTTHGTTSIGSIGTSTNPGLILAGGINWTSTAVVNDYSNIVTSTGGGSIDNQAAGLFTAIGTVSIAGAFSNHGTVVTAAGASLTFSGPNSNLGTIVDSSGTISFLSSLTQTGTVDLGATGTLYFSMGAGASQHTDFLGSGGEIELNSPSAFLSHIDDFGSGDIIDLLSTSASSLSYTAGTLAVLNSGGSTVATLNFDGTYTSSSFTLNTDGHGGSNITFT